MSTQIAAVVFAFVNVTVLRRHCIYTTRYGPQLMASSQITEYSLENEMENEWKKQFHSRNYELDRDAWNGVRWNGDSELADRNAHRKAHHKQITENYVKFLCYILNFLRLARDDCAP